MQNFPQMNKSGHRVQLLEKKKNIIVHEEKYLMRSSLLNPFFHATSICILSAVSFNTELKAVLQGYLSLCPSLLLLAQYEELLDYLTARTARCLCGVQSLLWLLLCSCLWPCFCSGGEVGQWWTGLFFKFLVIYHAFKRHEIVLYIVIIAVATDFPIYRYHQYKTGPHTTRAAVPMTISDCFWIFTRC